MAVLRAGNSFLRASGKVLVKQFGGIEYPNLAAPVSMWTIPSDSQGQLRASGDTFYQRGIGGWHELAWYEFVVEEPGEYEFNFDYDIPALAMWDSSGTYKHFGIYIAPTQPSVGDATQSFYNYTEPGTGYKSNRRGLDVADNGGNNLSGTIRNVLTLTAGHWWIWFPGAIAQDNVDYTFTFSNIVVRKLDTRVYVPSAFTLLEYIHNDSTEARITALLPRPIVNTDVVFGSVFYRDYDDYQQQRSNVYPLAFDAEGDITRDGPDIFVNVYNAYGNVDTFEWTNGRPSIGTGTSRRDDFGKVCSRVKGNVELINNSMFYRVSEWQSKKDKSSQVYQEKTINYCSLFGSLRRDRGQVIEVEICSLIGRLYEVYAKSGDTYLVRFVPVKRKSDNVLGFYELVSGQFFTDMNFQENFTAGPEL